MKPSLPSLPGYYKIAIARIEVREGPDECGLTSCGYVWRVTEVNVGAYCTHHDAVKALQGLCERLLEIELIRDKCDQLGLSYELAPEQRQDDDEIKNALDDGILLQTVTLPPELYSKVDKRLKENGVYDQLAQGVDGLRRVAQKGAFPIRILPSQKDPEPGDAPLRRRRAQRKAGRGRARSR